MRACDGMYISKKIFSNPFFSRHAKKKTARIETETNRTEKSIPLRAKSRIFFVTLDFLENVDFQLDFFFSFRITMQLLKRKKVQGKN